MNSQPNEKQTIMDIQRYLRQLSYHDPEIKPVPIDGIWNSDTEHALRSFQRKYDLPATGRADMMTWDTLFDEYNKSLERYSTPEMLRIFAAHPDGYILNFENIWEITVLRHILAELAKQYSFNNATEGNKYEPSVGQNISMFQRQNGLPDTSQVDKNTWNELAAQYNRSIDRYEQ